MYTPEYINTMRTWCQILRGYHPNQQTAGNQYEVLQPEFARVSAKNCTQTYIHMTQRVNIYCRNLSIDVSHLCILAALAA